MFITTLALPPIHPTIMPNDFETGPWHINSIVNDGKFYVKYL